MMLKRELKPALVLVLMLLAVGLAALAHNAEASGKAPVQSGTVEVRILNVAFDPQTITIKAGTTVRWVNFDPVVHDVTSGKVVSGRKARQVADPKRPDGKFGSGVFGKNETYTVTFDEKGVYPYYCNVHPVMTGTVVVE